MEDDTNIVFRLLWKPVARKSTGPLSRQQIENLKKYRALLRNEKLELEDVDWMERDGLGNMVGYQLLFQHTDGLYRILFDGVDDDKGRLFIFNIAL